MAELRDHELQSARAWLERLRGETSQEALAKDITETVGWSITRDRYSKYESGSLPFGREVLGHFVDYWAAKGHPGPDLTPPAPALSLEERAVIAAERQADAMTLIAWAMLSERGAVGGLPDQASRIQAFAAQAMERMTSPLPSADPVG